MMFMDLFYKKKVILPKIDQEKKPEKENVSDLKRVKTIEKKTNSIAKKLQLGDDIQQVLNEIDDMYDNYQKEKSIKNDLKQQPVSNPVLPQTPIKPSGCLSSVAIIPLDFPQKEFGVLNKLYNSLDLCFELVVVATEHCFLKFLVLEMALFVFHYMMLKRQMLVLKTCFCLSFGYNQLLRKNYGKSFESRTRF